MSNRIILLTYFSFNGFFIGVVSDRCKHNEIFHNNFRQCCEKLTCRPGYFYNCTKCSDCPPGTYMNERSDRTECIIFTDCDEGDISFEGNETHDRLCDLKSGGGSVLKWSSTTSSQTTSYDIPTVPTTPSPGLLGTWTIIAISVVVAIIIVTAALLVCLFIRRRRPNNRTYSSNEDRKPSPLILMDKESLSQSNVEQNQSVKSKEEFYGARENITENPVVLRRDMVSVDGLFWAALKEGDCYTYDDQQSEPLHERNKRILKLASMNEKKLRQLIYALKLTGQGHLADLISKSIAMETDVNKWMTFISEGDYKRKLRNNRVYILKNLSVTEDIWSHLRTNDAFTEQEEEICKSLTTNHAKTDYVIDHILKGDEKKFRAFLNALRGTRNDELADLLDGVKDHSMYEVIVKI